MAVRLRRRTGSPVGGRQEAALPPRDWLGRGGFMGLPWVAFPRHLAGLVLAVRVYGLSAIWLFCASQYFLWQLPLVLLRLLPDGGRAYRRACTLYDRYAQPAVLALPYSWCGLRVWTSQPALLATVPDLGSSVFMTNHSSRIDWIIGLLMGQVLEPRVRVGFVAEITTMLMPVFGWSRGLFGDIFLRRTFHRDGPRITRNIEKFHASGVDRVLFLAPEGAIVDPGVPRDLEYVAQCGHFLEKLGRTPFGYVLTPRYKGMQLIAAHAPDACFSVTMSFVCKAADGGPDDVVVDPATKAVRGGFFCTRPLSDPKRTIPDLHTVFRGGLHVFCHIAKADGAKLGAAADGDDVRDVLLDDYARKDALLEAFHETGKYDIAQEENDPDYDMVQLPVDHVRMNGALATILGLSYLVLTCVAGWTTQRVLSVSFASIATLFLAHAVTHYHAEQISGASRESLMFETVFKMLMQKAMGKLDHGGTSSSPAPDAPSPAAKLAGAVKAL